MPSDSLRSSSASPGAGFARHPLPHHVLLPCPRLCGRRRQRAPHVLPSSPSVLPVKCRLGSSPSATSLTRCRRPRCARPRHRPPHYPVHLCPGHCSRLRQCARHDRLHYLPHSSPLNRRGGSPPPDPPAPFPLRLCPWFLRSRPPARALVLTPDAACCGCSPGARLSCIPIRSRRHGTPRTCRSECILQSIHAVFVPLPAQGCACRAATPRCILLRRTMCYGVLRCVTVL